MEPIEPCTVPTPAPDPARAALLACLFLRAVSGEVETKEEEEEGEESCAIDREAGLVS